jgi:hypothetical protein
MGVVVVEHVASAMCPTMHNLTNTEIQFTCQTEKQFLEFNDSLVLFKVGV